MSIVIVYGPQQSGKTLNAEALKKHYNCKRVVDGWYPAIQLRNGDLVLTNEDPRAHGIQNAQIVHIQDALKALGSKARRPIDFHKSHKRKQ